MIYFPSRASEQVLREQAARAGMKPWTQADGRVIGWRSDNADETESAANRIVVFHGNAGYALHRTYFRDGLGAVNAGRTWEVYLLEYPGYGARPGSPGEKPFLEAGREALEELARIDDRPIYLLGESIGSGVACTLAAESPDDVAGLLLVTPFTTLAEVGAHHYPFLPVRLVLGRQYDNVSAIQHYRGPVAFLLAGQDEIIPAELGRELYERYEGPKRLWVQERATHNTMDYDPSLPWWQEMTEFLLKPR